MSNKVCEQTKDIEIMALTLYGEARDQGLDGMLAVASVIINRLDRPGWWSRNRDDVPDDTVTAVCLDPLQFSCWNEGGIQSQRDKLLALQENFYTEISHDNAALKECYWIACGILQGYLRSNVGKATHYHTASSKPKWRLAPSMLYVGRIGAHLFYVEG